jgi:hypothetical protein
MFPFHWQGQRVAAFSQSPRDYSFSKRTVRFEVSPGLGGGRQETLRLAGTPAPEAIYTSPDKENPQRRRRDLYQPRAESRFAPANRDAALGTRPPKKPSPIGAAQDDTDLNKNF